MIKLTILNILEEFNGILDLRKGFNKSLYTSCKGGFAENCLEVYENGADNLSNNLRLHKISILIFSQFYCKIRRNQLEIIVEATYGLHTY